MPSAILIFTRFPLPGKVKARLVPALGQRVAARLHRRMAEHTLKSARSVRSDSGPDAVEIAVCTSGARRGDFRAWLGRDVRYLRQASGDIGKRMREAFQSAFDRGAKSALLVGSDIPGLCSGILEKALSGLRDHDVVLGPAADGGYYLIGMNSPHPELFARKDWGTGSVGRQTRSAARNLGLTLMELPTLQDVDRPEDLASIRNDPRFRSALEGRAEVSVIIPTCNEAAAIGRTLRHLAWEPVSEIIVCDGGSADATGEIAAGAGAVVLKVPGGRARQQNEGAHLAKGDILLFLHADTLPPAGFGDIIREALDDPRTVAGAFRLRTDGAGIAMRLVEGLANFRSAFLQYPYGDQGLFMEKRVFDEEGGFSSLPIMEDFELVGRLRRRGRIATLEKAALTSARRWKRLGVLRTTLINRIMIAGFRCGIPAHRLERFYRDAGMRKNN
ncbi:MAG: TIGR04283 family arsenosugar biosynthesis glycosyltransferase [Acidobacteria bacterium]|nr:TIGR04283 family arsenosugar biosynthesis glycosyltransferase [Acidobacteriota bacterium]